MRYFSAAIGLTAASTFVLRVIRTPADQFAAMRLGHQ